MSSSNNHSNIRSTKKLRISKKDAVWKKEKGFVVRLPRKLPGLLQRPTGTEVASDPDRILDEDQQHPVNLNRATSPTEEELRSPRYISAVTFVEQHQHHQEESSKVPAVLLKVEPFLPKYLLYDDCACTKRKSCLDLIGWNCDNIDLKYLVSNLATLHHHLEIRLNGSVNLTDTALEYICHMSRLKTLHMSRCPNLTFTIPVMRKFRGLEFLTDLNLSWNDRLTDEAMRVVASVCFSLQVLNVSHCPKLSNQSMLFLSDRPTSHKSLTEVDISSCVQIDDTGVLALTSKNPSMLHTLRLSGCVQLSGIMCFSGLKRPKMRILDAHANTGLHGSSILSLVQSCAHLSELNVADCTDVITDESLCLMGKYLNRALRVLNIQNCDSVTDRGLLDLVRLDADELTLSRYATRYDLNDTLGVRCQHLERLNISGCYQVTDVSIKVLAAVCGHTFETLVARGCHHLTDVSLVALSTKCPNFSSLNCAGRLICSTKHGKRFYARPTFGLVGFRALFGANCCRELNLANVGGLDPHGVSALRDLRSLETLETLDLRSVVTPELLRVLSCRHWPALQRLSLSHSPWYRPQDAYTLLQHTPDLRSLDVAHCPQLTNELFVVLASCCPELRRLVVSHNWRLSNAGWRTFIEESKNRVREQDPKSRHAQPANTIDLKLESLVCDDCPELSSDVMHESVRELRCAQWQGGRLVPLSRSRIQFQQEQQARGIAAFRITHFIQRMIRQYNERVHALEHALRLSRKRTAAVAKIERSYRHYRHVVWLMLIMDDVRQTRHKRRHDRATQIQAWFRERMARVMYVKMRDFVRHERERKRLVRRLALEEASAITIQRHVRGFLGRKRASGIRTFQHTQHQKRLHVALFTQSHVRRHQAQRRYGPLIRTPALTRALIYVAQVERETHASLTLQSWSRGHLSFAKVQRREREILEHVERRDDAARIIGRCFRAYWIAVSWRRALNEGALGPQRLFRGNRGRQQARAYLLTYHYHTGTCPVLALCPRQSIFHVHHGQRLLQPLLERFQHALTIGMWCQRHVRGRQGRWIARQECGQARHVTHRRDQGAKVIQGFVRRGLRTKHRILVAAEMKRRREASVTIQSVYRMWCAKLVVFGKKYARNRARRMAQVLDWSRNREDWKKRLTIQSGAIYLLVRWYRHSLKSRGWISPSERVLRDVLATVLQARVRGHQTRAWFVHYRAALDGAARVIQYQWFRKLQSKKWQALLAELRRKQVEQDEDARAALVSSNVTKAYAFDELQVQTRASVVLQRLYRLWQKQHVFRNREETLKREIYAESTTRLAESTHALLHSDLFEAMCWKEVVSDKPYIPSEADELELRERKALALAAYQTDHYEYLMLMDKQKRLVHDLDSRHGPTRRFMKRETESLQCAIKPFGTQAKILTKDHARVSKVNKTLQREIIRLKKILTDFHQAMADRWTYDPVIYGLDMHRVLSHFDGHWGHHSRHLYEEVWHLMYQKYGPDAAKYQDRVDHKT